MTARDDDQNRPPQYGGRTGSSPRPPSGKYGPLKRLVEFVLTERRWSSLLFAQDLFLKLPNQSAAHRFYKLLLPLALTGPLLLCVVWLVIVPWKMSEIVSFTDNMASAIMGTPHLLAGFVSSIVVAATYQLAVTLITFYYLWRGLRPAQLPTNGPRLTHVVVIPNYREPLSVLGRTLNSLARQTLSGNLVVLMAMEKSDPRAQETFSTLHKTYASCFKDMWCTEHEMAEGEIPGKSANENDAVRWLYGIMVPQYDPFSVMVTICDADSDFESRYLEQLESTFYQYPDGKRLIFDGPLNTYRNYLEANLLIRQFEINKCHAQLSQIWRFQAAQSNYSLTLGFAKEIDFWTPDNTPEDLHTTVKSFLLTYGSQTVAPVWSVISNDTVVGLKDRYTQAKRHAWGVTEIAWVLAVFKPLKLRIWIRLFAYLWRKQLYRDTTPGWLMLLFPAFWNLLFSVAPLTLYFLILVAGFHFAWQWFLMCLRELLLHYTVLAHRDTIQKPRWHQLLMTFLLYPITNFVSTFIFTFVSRWHCILRAFFSTDLMYITAPKGVGEDQFGVPPKTLKADVEL